METIKVKLTLTEGILGTSPFNEDIYRDFIGSKAPDASTIEDEVAAIGADAVTEKGMTGFPRDENGKPFIYDYQIKGFFKDACSMLNRVGGKDENGNVVEESAARFETDPEGGSVAVGVLDDDTLEPTAPAEVFGDYDPWGYLGHALKLLAPARAGNIPDFESIFKKAYQDHGNDDCPMLYYCDRPSCDDCIVHQWMEEVDEEDTAE